MPSLEIAYQDRRMTVSPCIEETFVVDTDLGFDKTGVVWIGVRWDDICAMVRMGSCRGAEVFHRSRPEDNFVREHLTRMADLSEVRQWSFPGDRHILSVGGELRLGGMEQDQIVIRHQRV